MIRRWVWEVIGVTALMGALYSAGTCYEANHSPTRKYFVVADTIFVQDNWPPSRADTVSWCVFAANPPRPWVDGWSGSISHRRFEGDAFYCYPAPKGDSGYIFLGAKIFFYRSNGTLEAR